MQVQTYLNPKSSLHTGEQTDLTSVRTHMAGLRQQLRDEVAKVRKSDRQGTILDIIFPGPGKLRSRKVVKRSGTRGTFKYPSWKMNRMIQAESTHELHAFKLLDFDPRVIQFHEQPCLIHYMVDGVLHHHFPDVLVEFENSKEIWEVKTERDAASSEIAARTCLLQAALTAYGFRYRTITDRDLSDKSRLQNADTVLQFGRRSVTDTQRELVRQAFYLTGSVRWREATSGLLGQSGRQTVCRLVLEGRLSFNETTPLTPETEFRSGMRKL